MEINIGKSETSKHRDKVMKYIKGNGLDCGSAGDPIIPTAIQIELPNNYCPFFETKYPPQLRGDAKCLYWFKDNCMDYVFSSHLIEDFTAPIQKEILQEWIRVLKPGGHLVVLAPEKTRWKQALANGQSPNLAHQNEPAIGEFSKMVQGVDVVEDRFCDDSDYGMMFVARKK